ncbi:hypothetical protein ACFJIW_05575 [Tahibacter sp. UC22_41]|uniref:hypothetical protein n=1 Tax=Tahibacter sp. UC22_41 TaxID=3350178 RepID=UPI0036D9D9C3
MLPRLLRAVAMVIERRGERMRTRDETQSLHRFILASVVACGSAESVSWLIASSVCDMASANAWRPHAAGRDSPRCFVEIGLRLSGVIRSTACSRCDVAVAHRVAATPCCLTADETRITTSSIRCRCLVAVASMPVRVD